MPKASKTTASESMQVEGYEGHFESFDGDYTVGFETYTADADLAPLFAGLPDDRCQCAHWGYVIRGKLTFKTAKGDETFQTGDAYYVGPGHTPVLYRAPKWSSSARPNNSKKHWPSSKRTWRTPADLPPI